MFGAALQRDYFSSTILVKFRSLKVQTLEATDADSMRVILQQPKKKAGSGQI